MMMTCQTFSLCWPVLGPDMNTGDKDEEDEDEEEDEEVDEEVGERWTRRWTRGMHHTHIIHTTQTKMIKPRHGK